MEKITITVPTVPKLSIKVPGSGSAGTTDHAQLNNLDYDNSGHTGFQRELTAEQLANIAAVPDISEKVDDIDLSGYVEKKEAYGLTSLMIKTEPIYDGGFMTGGMMKHHVLFVDGEEGGGEVEIPAYTSDLTNDSGFVTEEQLGDIETDVDEKIVQLNSDIEYLKNTINLKFTEQEQKFTEQELINIDLGQQITDLELLVLEGKNNG